MRAPLASMEDISQVNTPLPTPGPSPRSRHRWSIMSHRSSLGIILDEDEDEKLVEETTVMTPVPEIVEETNDDNTDDVEDIERETVQLLPEADQFMTGVRGIV